MFVHNIDPVIFSLGPLAIRWYGLAYVIGFLLAYWWMSRPQTLAKIKNFTKKDVDSFLTYLILGVVVGGRVLQFVFYRPAELFSNPLELFQVWHGGMSFHGGLIGAALAVWFYVRKNKINFLELADQLVVPASFALGIGRIANFINAEMVGPITNVGWCVQFPNYEGCRHPTQLYESLKTFFIFGILWWNNERTKKNYVVGTQLWLFITLYGFLRFALNFYRIEETALLGISMGQFLSLAMGLFGLSMLVNNKYKLWKSRKH